jgi:uncharacterized cupredoxin-like copper-binding protein
VVLNKGQHVHELILGREADLKRHVEDRKKPGFKDHGHHDNEASVEPDKSAVYCLFVLTFQQYYVGLSSWKDT